MRKTLIATATACLLSAALTGCGNQSSASQTADQLEELLDKMSAQLDAPATPFEGNAGLYTNGTTVNGVEVPGVLSTEAAHIDQSLALLPMAQEIATSGNEQQQKAANSIIASILADEGSYLIGVSQSGYQQVVNELGEMRVRINLLEEIVALDRALSGDRAEEIDTYRTGKVDDNTSVQGINQLNEQAGTAKQAAEAARAELAKLTAKIDELSEKVAEFESVELKLSNDALGSEGKIKFEKLDQATSAWQEARSAEAEAEKLGLEAQMQEQQAKIAEVRQAGSEGAVAALEEKIGQIEAEKRQIADKLAQLDADRKKTIDTLTKAFNRLDNEIKVLGFDRMAKAQKKLAEANQALSSASLGSSADMEMLSIYLLQARSLQQQSLSARAYGALLSSLAANGPDVLGAGLHGALTKRIGEMNAKVAAIAANTGKLMQEAGIAIGNLATGVDPASPEGAAVLKNIDLFSTLISSVGPQGGADLGPGGDFDVEIIEDGDEVVDDITIEIEE